ncbi:pseudouridine synthase [Luteibaculum oceani]|uniref:Pseudouridine synthase n=1 Tax=Luteibaculum oceani TaxID=1294296 RepID=A0A5C6V9I1_9FLAO|nr:pseudouridine synthase [Luteibaculum oceani]TXC82152.1 pseudouridine synthase [Luteibaculum oceani]
MFKYYVINKPFDVLTGFTSEKGVRNLSELFNFPKDVYPVGRLDKDSEGLLVLTNDPSLNKLLLDSPKSPKKEYTVQVDGAMTYDAVNLLKKGVTIRIKGREYLVTAKGAELTSEPDWIWERNPPVRFRKAIPTSWLKIELNQGKNRQVRRMTAAVGHPTLRLIRSAIGNLRIEDVNTTTEFSKKDLLNALGI